MFLEEFDAFWQFWLSNKICIPKNTAGKVGRFLNALQTSRFRFAEISHAENAAVKDSTILDGLHKSLGESNKSIPDLVSSLEDDFQRILGLPTEEMVEVVDMKTDPRPS